MASNRQNSMTNALFFHDKGRIKNGFLYVFVILECMIFDFFLVQCGRTMINILTITQLLAPTQ